MEHSYATMTIGSDARAPWIGSRVARPAGDLNRSIAFYRDVLGLRRTGGFDDHDGYSGAFFALPDGGELELTTGPVQPDSGAPDDLLVLYVATLDEVESWTGVLLTAGIELVPAENPYWNRWGHTFLDPDGYRLVIAARDIAKPSEPPVRIEWHEGPRAELRPLFAAAEDSAEQLASYFDVGRVLVARRDATPIGHLQLAPGIEPGEIEIKNMAVETFERGRGVGRALVAEALRRCTDERWERVSVATAAADTGNLRFYQRCGFRIASVERDAFTPATGYPDPIHIDGIVLRDRVWLARDLSAPGA